MSLPFDFSATLESFECPESIVVYEKNGQYINGYWQETIGARRELNCILLDVDDNRVRIFPQGKNIDGAYSIMYSGDEPPLYAVSQDGRRIQGLQTFAIIDGLEYIVMNNPETVKNANFHSYYAIRYKEQVNG